MENTGLPSTFQVYDTTLRDGAQQEGLSLSVQDKLAIAGHLDDLGVGFIEGGWPGAIPKDTEFFRRAATELNLKQAVLTAFGATRKAGLAVHADPQVQALVDSLAPAVTLVAKSDIRHVERALRTTAEENLAMVTETVRYLRDQAAGCSSTPSTSSTVTTSTAPTPWKWCGRRPRRAPRQWCFATPTAGCCPTRWPTWCTTSPRPPVRRWGSTATTTPAAQWPTHWLRWTPEQCRCRAR